MVDVGGRWIEPTHESVYHGRANGDGGPVWVYPRLHSHAGLHVEVHHLAADGPLLRRTAVQHRAEARDLVERLRLLTASRGVEEVVGDVVPLVARGRLVLHGARRRYAFDAATLDDGPATELCAVLWASPGLHHISSGVLSTMSDDPLSDRLRRVRRTNADVTLEAGTTVEFWLRWVRGQWRSDRPRVHWPCAAELG